MRADQSVKVQLTARNGEPLPIENVLIVFHFLVRGQYRYGFKVGRTDKSGSLRVSYESVEKIRAANAQQYLMDCNTPLEQCDETIKIIIPSEAELRQQAEDGKRSHLAPPEWAANWPSNARVKPLEKVVELRGQVISVPMPAQLAD